MTQDRCAKNEKYSIKEQYRTKACVDCEFNHTCAFMEMMDFSDRLIRCDGELVSEYRYID